MPEKKQNNPGYQVGTDFISNNRVPQVDFATIHFYPEQWLSGSTDEVQAAFVDKWVESHIEDSKIVLQKPILLTEFGKSSRSGGYSVSGRDNYFSKLYNTVYNCAKNGGPCGFGMATRMDGFRDGYEVVFEESPSTAAMISQQSHKLSSLN